MENEKSNELVPGQIVAIVGGKYKGQAGEVRAFPRPGAVTVRIGADYHTVKAENVGVNNGEG